ncbi:MAG TPA: glucose-6-phosphate isomerase, partial [Porticoccus sp.]|nr:glucose-6-phosphate isomerase [Porticoccus sp.]
MNETNSNPNTGFNPCERTSWKQLEQDAELAKNRHLKTYFAQNSNRCSALRFNAAGINADLSRNHIDESILAHLIALAEDAGMSQRIEALFSGKPVNFTEHRAALHMALRGPWGLEAQQLDVDNCLQHMQRISEQLNHGQWLGFSQQAITDVVNIGIGGSDLGPRMVVEALQPFQQPGITVHFVANIDPSDLQQTLAGLNRETTLFIVASKSWSTLETLTNARAAKKWLSQGAAAQTDLSNHFIAISARPDRCAEFGIAAANILPMWDWVGGRFSLWSAVGLSIAIATGFDNFRALLNGARAMDEHFSSAPLANNLPVILSMLEIWYVNFWGSSSSAVLPYDHNLRLLPDHLQQLIMESNGKQVSQDGKPLPYATSPVIWGAAGSNGQHSFHQLLHQGTQLIPVDFILPLSSHSNAEQHLHLVANCLAQAEALMDGQDQATARAALIEAGTAPDEADRMAAHRAIPGNRPSTIITMTELNPST